MKCSNIEIKYIGYARKKKSVCKYMQERTPIIIQYADITTLILNFQNFNV